MAYIQPQLKIFQEFEAALTSGLAPLYACVIGPQYAVHSGNDCGSLGAYDRTQSVTYSWPDKSAGSTVEQDTAVVNMKDAYLNYYLGTGFAIPAGEAPGSNLIYSAGLVLQTANGYDRSSVFGTRDVAIGDKVKVNWGTNEVNTQVAGFIAETVNTVGNAVPATSNQVTTSAIAPSIDSYSFADDALSVTAAGTYNGLADGVVSETYSMIVTKEGGSGVAEMSVVSTSGTDDVATQVINYTGTPIGTRGVSCTFDETASSESSVAEAGMSSSSASMSESSQSHSESSNSEEVVRDFAVGDTFVISAQQAYTVPAPIARGTYAGHQDTNYIIKIVSGGVVDTDTLVYSVTTDDGYDVQGNTTVSANGDLVIGNYGVLMTINPAEQYVTGDAWSIAALASAQGAVKTIMLADKLIDDSSGSEAGPSDSLTTSISLVDDVVLSPSHYTTTATTLTVLASATYIGDYLGTETAYDILSADMCVDYREMIITNTTSIGSIDQISDVENELGLVSTKNPLAKGVYSALLNSNGNRVYYMAVATDDFSGYSKALDLLSNNDLIYSLVPLNKTVAVRDLFQGHVAEQSSELRNNWRIAWVNAADEQATGIYTETTLGEPIKATLDDPALGSNYVHIESDGALFVTNGVRAGDELRINYRPYGDTTIYDVGIVDTVTEDEITLVAPLSEEQQIATKIEIHRELTETQYALSIAQTASSIHDRRMYYVWPDVISDGTEEVSGMYLCAALAGLRSGSAPHAPLTNVEITGFYNPTRSLMFSAAQLNVMAGGGTWIVTESLDGMVYTRHQVSTDNSDINKREQTITTNLDSISRQFRESFSDIIGRGNVSEDMINLIKMRVHTTASSIQSLPYSVTLGPQLQDYEITQLEVDPVLRDHIRLTIAPVLPYPLNNLDITMLIS